jgi:hypothetical protein
MVLFGMGVNEFYMKLYKFIKTARKPQPFKAGDEWQPGAKPEFHLA